MRKKKDSSPFTQSSEGLRLASVDSFENFYYYRNSDLAINTPIRKIKNFPELPKKNYLFDMGYPYFMSLKGNHVAFTSDLGLFIFELTP